jgi:L-2-hydroxycarboxylate dehydrogenase (NAD+)
VTVSVPYAHAREVILDVLGGLGAAAQHAGTQATWLLEADLRGHPSHGMQRLPMIAQRIANGVADPSAEPDLEWITPAMLVVDGHRGLGPCVGSAVMTPLIERAKTHGVAVAAVANANHLGLLAPYVERCAAQSLIGIAMTTSEALVHPWGGRRAMVGTNPLAVAVPAEPFPFVFDMATGAVSMGRILDRRNRDLPLEPGWAIDSAGRPTLDAAAAVTGAIAPFGGAKGYGLGLAIELIVASMTGTALGIDVVGTLDAETICNKGDVFICLDPARFGRHDFMARIGDYLDAVRETAAQDGSGGVLVPGDRARADRARRLTDGLPIADSVWATVLALRTRQEARS